MVERNPKNLQAVAEDLRRIGNHHRRAVPARQDVFEEGALERPECGFGGQRRLVGIGDSATQLLPGIWVEIWLKALECACTRPTTIEVQLLSGLRFGTATNGRRALDDPVM